MVGGPAPQAASNRSRWRCSSPQLLRSPNRRRRSLWATITSTCPRRRPNSRLRHRRRCIHINNNSPLPRLSGRTVHRLPAAVARSQGRSLPRDSTERFHSPQSARRPLEPFSAPTVAQHNRSRRATGQDSPTPQPWPRLTPHHPRQPPDRMLLSSAAVLVWEADSAVPSVAKCHYPVPSATTIRM